MPFLPCTLEECRALGWEEIDFLFVTADAYVDHPSFGTALLSRLLESEGYRVGILPQPDIDDPACLKIMGRPRLGVLVSSGAVDSMVDNYSASRRPRTQDRYSPGGHSGRRPDRVTIRYCNMARAQFGDIPLVIGGIEPSLRRFAHYDYWDDAVRRSILQDSRADILVYGMGERALLSIAALLAKGVSVANILTIPGTCVMVGENRLPRKTASFLAENGEVPDAASRPLDHPFPEDVLHVLLPSYEQVLADRRTYADAFRMQYLEQVPVLGRTLLQRHGVRYVVQNPPARVLRQKELDRLYALPYERRPHPMYEAMGGVPSIEEVSFSITAHRGCFGGCNFCAITFHQGRAVQNRSQASIVEEARRIIDSPGFKGYIHDVGGPTANFHTPVCAKMEKGEVCRDRRCLFPQPCPNLRADHTEYLSVLRSLRALPGVKKVFIRSGVRFDYLLADIGGGFLEELCRHHVSGQLKVAPEHVCDHVLAQMGKPPSEVFERFRADFDETNRSIGMEQYLVPYLISGHPGSTLKDAIEMALYIKRYRVIPEQVQDFYPTPGTVSTTMYYTGLDPLTMKPVYVPGREEKAMQRALLQYSLPRSRPLVEKALSRAGRTDLIGYGPDCLISPASSKNLKNQR